MDCYKDDQQPNSFTRSVKCVLNLLEKENGNHIINQKILLEAPCLLASIFSKDIKVVAQSLSKLIEFAKVGYFDIDPAAIKQLKRIADSNEECDETDISTLASELLSYLYGFPGATTEQLSLCDVLSMFVENFTHNFSIRAFAKYAKFSTENRNDIIGFNIIEDLLPVVARNIEIFDFKILCDLLNSLFWYEFKSCSEDDWFYSQSCQLFSLIFGFWNTLSSKERSYLVDVFSTICRKEYNINVLIEHNCLQAVLSIPENDDNNYLLKCLQFTIFFLKSKAVEIIGANMPNEIWDFAFDLCSSEGLLSQLAGSVIYRLAELYPYLIIKDEILKKFFETFHESSFDAKKALGECLAMLITQNILGDSASILATPQIFSMLSEIEPEATDDEFPIFIFALSRISLFYRENGSNLINEFMESNEDFQTWISSQVEVVESPDFALEHDNSIIENVLFHTKNSLYPKDE